MRARVRVAIWCWLIAGVVAWNVTFDFLITRGVKEYRFRRAAYDAGQGPRVVIDDIMVPTVEDAAAIASVAGGCVAAAGLATIALLTRKQ